MAILEKIFSGLVFSASLLEVILVSLIIIWYGRRHQLKEASLCFDDCAGLKNGFTKSGLLKHQMSEYGNSTDGVQCCVNVIDVLEHVISETEAYSDEKDFSLISALYAFQKITSRYDSSINPEYPAFDLTVLNCTVSEDTSATLHLRDIDTSGQRKPSVILWKTFFGKGTGLRYLDKEGIVAVQKSGLYLVTTQVTFIVENKTSIANELHTFRHLVIRMSDKTKKELILIESKFSSCQMPSEQSEKSTSMAAVFRLEKNDEIYVSVSNPSHVLLQNGKHLFSINKLYK